VAGGLEGVKAILAIDPSSTVAGWAVLNGSVQAAGVIDLTQEPPWLRYTVLIAHVAAICVKHDVGGIVCERAFSQGYNTAPLSVAVNCVEAYAKQEGQPFTLYSPSQWKRDLTGSGKATKEHVQAVVRNIAPEVGAVLDAVKAAHVEHVGDAIGLGLAHRGHFRIDPLKVSPPKRAASRAKIKPSRA